ncbi:kinase-like protein, partial [Dendrothele bispora CBS 962.96]
LPEYMFISGVAPVKERNIFGGTYGDVYRSTFEGKPVALKRLRIFQRSDDDERRSLYKVTLMWQTLRHEFVLPFLGIDAENFPRQPCMVSPWMSNGTLIHFLKRNPKANVDKLLFEIAQGIDYLHSQNIVHGDIKGVNILIDEHWKPLLADFGLTLFADATRHNTTGQGGTLRWMAPELFAGYDDSTPSKRTFASDIYAYGCLCVEAYTRKIPFYHEVRNEFGIIGFAKGGGRPSRPTESSAMTDELWELVNACWHQNPSSRPKSAMVVAVLRTILRKSATDNSQQLRSTLSKMSFASSMSGGVSLHSNLNNPITSATGEESVKKTMSPEDHAELARCRKRIRRHADPNRMYQDVKILRYRFATLSCLFYHCLKKL